MRTLCLVAFGLVALGAALPTARGARAMPAWQSPGDGAVLLPVADGDLPTSNGRHRGGRKRGPIAHDPSPTVPDMHGATREDADKQYRQKYGF